MITKFKIFGRVNEEFKWNNKNFIYYTQTGVDNDKVNRLMRIITPEWIKNNPVAFETYKGKLYLTEGHHRFEAALRLNDKNLIETILDTALYYPVKHEPRKMKKRYIPENIKLVKENMITKFNLFQSLDSADIYLIYELLKNIREHFIEINYHKDLGLGGFCLEASKKIVDELKKIGYNAIIVEGNFLINEDMWKSNPTGEPCPKLTNHVWVETNGYLIDVTHDQYSDAIEEKLPDIVFDKIENCPRYIRNENEYWKSIEKLY